MAPIFDLRMAPKKLKTALKVSIPIARHCIQTLLRMQLPFNVFCYHILIHTVSLVYMHLYVTRFKRNLIACDVYGEKDIIMNGFHGVQLPLLCPQTGSIKSTRNNLLLSVYPYRNVIMTRSLKDTYILMRWNINLVYHSGVHWSYTMLIIFPSTFNSFLSIIQWMHLYFKFVILKWGYPTHIIIVLLVFLCELSTHWNATFFLSIDFHSRKLL